MLKLLGVTAALCVVACGSADTKPEVEVVVVNGSTTAAATSTGAGGSDAGGCASNADCKNGFACANMACVEELQEGADCTVGAQPCATDLWCNDKCVPKEPSGQICGGDDAACLSGTCTKGADGFSRCQ